jgi:hypothetical protein
MRRRPIASEITFTRTTTLKERRLQKMCRKLLRNERMDFLSLVHSQALTRIFWYGWGATAGGVCKYFERTAAD